MNTKEINQLVTQIETLIECWKQFQHFINLARTKKFTAADEDHFLELKSVIVQGLEPIYAAMDINAPARDDVHSLIGNTPSLRLLNEASDNAMRNLESQWHAIYIGWHAILGRIKVHQAGGGTKLLWSKTAPPAKPRH